jgi:ankyrin repeat protein
LHRAAGVGDAAYLAEVDDVNVKDDDGRTPLSFAAKNGQRESCAVLLDKGATHEPDKSGNTPLAFAAAYGQVDVCDFLLSRGATHEPDKSGNTPLAFAAAYGHVNVCALLLSRGATHEPDKSGSTPLFAAAVRGQKDVCKLLLDTGATHEPNNQGFTPLYFAAYGGHEDLCALLLDRGATQVSSKHGTPLHSASGSGHTRVCALLLDRGATHEPDPVFGTTPLHKAAYNGYSDLCALLLDQGANIDARDYTGATPLFSAVDSSIYMWYCRYTNAKGTPPLDIYAEERVLLNCAVKDKQQVCDLLVQRGADVHVRNGEGKSLLHAAARLGHAGLCAFFLKLGVDAGAVDNAGSTPAHTAAVEGKDDIFILLYHHVAAPAAVAASQKMVDTSYGRLRDKERLWSPLHEAAFLGKTSICAMLIDAGADVQAIDSRGRTPLHVAAENDFADVCSLLISRGATQIRDAEGMTPFDVFARRHPVGVLLS